VFPATAIVPLAHARSSSATRFGTAAREAIQNGCETTEPMNPSVSNQGGLLPSSRTVHTIAPATSEAIITPRLSNRSAISPATGFNSPVMPNVKKNVADSQTAECVRPYMSAESAIAAIWEPVPDSSRPSASRRIAPRPFIAGG
jgi:hypothetical protein